MANPVIHQSQVGGASDGMPAVKGAWKIGGKYYGFGSNGIGLGNPSIRTSTDGINWIPVAVGDPNRPGSDTSESQIIDNYAVCITPSRQFFFVLWASSKTFVPFAGTANHGATGDNQIRYGMTLSRFNIATGHWDLKVATGATHFILKLNTAIHWPDDQIWNVGSDGRQAISGFARVFMTAMDDNTVHAIMGYQPKLIRWIDGVAIDHYEEQVGYWTNASSPATATTPLRAASGGGTGAFYTDTHGTTRALTDSTFYYQPAITDGITSDAAGNVYAYTSSPRVVYYFLKGKTTAPPFAGYDAGTGDFRTFPTGADLSPAGASPLAMNRVCQIVAGGTGAFAIVEDWFAYNNGLGTVIHNTGAPGSPVFSPFGHSACFGGPPIAYTPTGGAGTAAMPACNAARIACVDIVTNGMYSREVVGDAGSQVGTASLNTFVTPFLNMQGYTMCLLVDPSTGLLNLFWFGPMDPFITVPAVIWRSQRLGPGSWTKPKILATLNYTFESFGPPTTASIYALFLEPSGPGWAASFSGRLSDTPAGLSEDTTWLVSPLSSVHNFSGVGIAAGLTQQGATGNYAV